jgi:hypothetical protein
MSNSNGRITRKNFPKKPVKRTRYKTVKPNLLLDFDGRCAYSMQHQSRCEIEVDHFDPKQKKDLIQNYNNLFPASRLVNITKSDSWPTASEQDKGLRFLNPCTEKDYDHVIFEDQRTHLLIGTTPAARWHIRMCGLNAHKLREERARRAEYLELLRDTPVRIKSDDVVAAKRSTTHSPKRFT